MIKDFKLKYKYGKINRMSWKRMDAKMFNYMKLVHSTSSEKYREIEKKLREKEIYFPSYKKILSTLERLESWNFLTRRYEEGTKEKFYWIINPQFYHKFGSEFEAMLEKDNKK